MVCFCVLCALSRLIDMAGFLSSELAGWLASEWKNSQCSFSCSGISHDTRTLKPGEVYIALRGEHHDGHDFAEQAAEKSAAALIAEQEFPGIRIPQVIVPDTMKALWQLADGVRSEWSGTVIGITGSAGKTTVKEMIASVLSQKGSVAKTPGNWNNDIGLPLSMLAADRQSDFFVFELGMNHPGEIDQLASLLRPDWGIVTNIGKAHIEFFKGLEDIADEKASLLRHASQALLDIKSPWFEQMKKQAAGPVFTLTEKEFRVPFPGEHMMQNARFAATLGQEIGLSDDDIQCGLDIFSPGPMRWERIERNGITFINDAYNANPLSVRASLSAFAELPCTGRKFAVLGAMRELGASAEAEHRALGNFVDTLNLDCVLTIGAAGKLMECRGTLGVGKEEAVSILCEELRRGDRVLLKASRGERLETVLEETLKRLAEAD